MSEYTAQQFNLTPDPGNPGDELSLRKLDQNLIPVAQVAFGNDSNTYLSFKSVVGGSMTEHMLINADGNVGIGTGTPGEKLEVAGAVKATAFDGNLNGSQITTGTVAEARIDTAIVRTSALAAANGIATLDSNALVVQNPANATATPAGSKIPMADASGKLTAGWGGNANTLGTLDANTRLVQSANTLWDGTAGRSASPTAAANTIPVGNASGKLASGWGGSASTLATLDASSLVVQNPANATETPTASKIPIADASGKLAAGWGGNAGTLATLDANTRLVQSANTVWDGTAGRSASPTPMANTIPVLNASAKFPGSITGDADTLDTYHASAFPRLAANNTFTQRQDISNFADADASVECFRLTPTDYGSGKPFLFMKKNGAATFHIGTWDGVTTSTGNINFTTGTVKINGNPVWHSGNDGSGSGLDADLLDGQQGTYYLAASSYTASDVLTKLKTVDGSGSGLDADLLDGHEATYFQIAGNYITALTGDVTASGPGSVAATITNNSVTLAKMADMATASFLGRNTAGTGDPEVLSATTATAMLNNFTSAVKGLVPASGGGTANFLRADGTWTAPAGLVTSVAGRTGAVTLAQADVSGLTTGSCPTFIGVRLNYWSATHPTDNLSKFTMVTTNESVPALFISNGTGLGALSWWLVGPQLIHDEILAVAQTNVDISVDANTHGGYEFEFVIGNTSGANRAYRIYFNGDYVTTNYNWWHTGTGIMNDCVISPQYLATGTEYKLIGRIIRSAGGSAVCMITFAARSDDGFYGQAIVRKLATVTNITSIRISSDSGTGIAANSTFRLWRMK